MTDEVTIEARFSDSRDNRFEVIRDGLDQQGMTAVELRKFVIDNRGTHEQAEELVRSCRESTGQWQSITVAPEGAKGGGVDQTR
jgi:hypothetical protein